MLDQYLPRRTATRHTNDKPWITDEFRRLIRRRQYAFTHDDQPLYRRLCNAVNRASKRLRKRYYMNEEFEICVHAILQTGGAKQSV